jgi:WD40 repeat protein
VRVSSDQITPLLDPPDAQTMAWVVTEEAQRAESVLLVYFIGHGLLGPGDELYLAASGTDRLTPGLAEHQALSFSSLRQALGASRASSVVVMLDCCFSGRVSLGDRTATPKALPALSAHTAPVDSLAVSPRRDLLASTSLDGHGYLWDIADATHPEQVQTFDVSEYTYSDTTHLTPLHRAAFDRTGTLLAVPGMADNDEQLHLWDIDDPRAPRRIEQPEEYATPYSCTWGITSIAFSQEKDNVVAGCDGGWQVWVYATGADGGVLVPGATKKSQDSEQIGVVVFDPVDSHRLLQATDGGLLVWDLSNPGQPGVRSYLPSLPSTGAQMAYRAAWKRRLVALQTFGSNTLWDVTDPTDGHIVSKTPAPDMFTGSGIALSPDGRTLADIEIFPVGEETHYGLRLRGTADPGARPCPPSRTSTTGSWGSPSVPPPRSSSWPTPTVSWRRTAPRRA